MARSGTDPCVHEVRRASAAVCQACAPAEMSLPRSRAATAMTQRCGIRFYNNLQGTRGLPKYLQAVQDIAHCGLGCGLGISVWYGKVDFRVFGFSNLRLSDPRGFLEQSLRARPLDHGSTVSAVPQRTTKQLCGVVALCGICVRASRLATHNRH